MPLFITPYSIAEKFIGVAEVPGRESNPQIMAMLELDEKWPEGDEVPWCSAFANYICWLAGAPRSKKLNARSWLDVGEPATLDEANADSHIVVLSRGKDPKSGHVGFFAGRGQYPDGKGYVMLLGGNQGDSVNIAKFPVERVIGVRRIA